MATEEDYEYYQYSDEDGYSVEEDGDDMEWDSNENPNAPPVQYSKTGRYLLVAEPVVAGVRKTCARQEYTRVFV
jgi:hypothetical protein